MKSILENPLWLVFIIWVVPFIACCLILYYIIKSAVKNAILEARYISTGTPEFKSTLDYSNDSELSTAQKDLKARYERSELSFEEYQKEWNQLLK